ncbi:MAG TPA: hypothetical protein VFM35_02330 [Candidatus Binatia bacterium]|nr:hypothetical protein [Candidatus Binatia bacterium]
MQYPTSPLPHPANISNLRLVNFRHHRAGAIKFLEAGGQSGQGRDRDGRGPMMLYFRDPDMNLTEMSNYPSLRAGFLE